MYFDTEVKSLELPTEVSINTSISGNGDVIRLKGEVNELWNIWQLRRNTIVMSILMCGTMFCYFLVNFMMRKFPGDIVSNTITSQNSEFVATLIGSFVYMMCGPRISLCLHFLVTAFGSIGLILLPGAKYETPLIYAAKFGVSGTLNICFIAYVQITPTVLRSTTFGIGNVASRIVSIFAPLAATYSEETALTMNAATAFIAALASMFLVTDLPKFQ